MEECGWVKGLDWFELNRFSTESHNARSVQSPNGLCNSTNALEKPEVGGGTGGVKRRKKQPWGTGSTGLAWSVGVLAVQRKLAVCPFPL